MLDNRSDRRDRFSSAAVVVDSASDESVSSSTGRPRRLDTPGQLFDLAVGGVEARYAHLVELLAPLPELDRLVEIGVAALQPLDDLLQLALRVFEPQLAQSACAPNRPSATSTSRASPLATVEALRTI